MEITRSGSVDRIVEPAKVLDHKVNHGLDRLVVLDVHLKDRSLVLLITGILLALLRRGLDRLDVHIGEHNDLGASLCEGESGLPVDAAAGLYIEQRIRNNWR